MPDIKDLRLLFHSEVENILEEIKKHDNIVNFYLAISGGVDSMALLDLFLYEATHNIKIKNSKITILHFNHRIREESELDAESILKYLANKKSEYAGKSKYLKIIENIDFVVGSSDVIDFANKKNVSLELAARDARYSFFKEQINKANEDKKDVLNVLMLAHHMEDQSETVLLHLFRGCGIDGISGMAKKEFRDDLNVWLSRPLLQINKNEIIEYCKNNCVEWKEDQTNLSNDYARNYLRNKVFPDLKENINPSIDKAIYRSSMLFGEINDFLDYEVEKVKRECITDFSNAEGWSSDKDTSIRNAKLLSSLYIDGEKLKNYPEVIRKLLIKKLLFEFADGDEIRFEDIEQIFSLFSSESNKKIEHYGMIFLSDSLNLLIYKKSEKDELSTCADRLRIDLKELKNEKVIEFKALKAKLRISISENVPKQLKVGGNNICYVNIDELKELNVRGIFDDDEFTSFSGNSKSLKRKFTDWKIPTKLRKTWPVIEANGNIIWVPGLGRTNLYTVKNENNKILMMKWEEL